MLYSLDPVLVPSVDLVSAKIRPTVNQIEAHPYLQQRDLLEWSKDNVSLPNTFVWCTEYCMLGFPY